jgi:hypothetical protein
MRGGVDANIGDLSLPLGLGKEREVLPGLLLERERSPGRSCPSRQARGARWTVARLKWAEPDRGSFVVAACRYGSLPPLFSFRCARFLLLPIRPHDKVRSTSMDAPFIARPTCGDLSDDGAPAALEPSRPIRKPRFGHRARRVTSAVPRRRTRADSSACVRRTGITRAVDTMTQRATTDFSTRNASQEPLHGPGLGRPAGQDSAC